MQGIPTAQIFSYFVVLYFGLVTHDIKSDTLFLVFTSAWMMMGLFTAQGLQMMKMQSLTL
jgi:hypothetical protein